MITGVLETFLRAAWSKSTDPKCLASALCMFSIHSPDAVLESIVMSKPLLTFGETSLIRVHSSTTTVWCDWNTERFVKDICMYIWSYNTVFMPWHSGAETNSE